MANNKEVIQSWIQGTPAKTSLCGRNYRLHTNGFMLFSYGLMIAYVAKNGNRVTIDYTGKDGFSRTTSKHVNMAKVRSHAVVSAAEYDPDDRME